MKSKRWMKRMAILDLLMLGTLLFLRISEPQAMQTISHESSQIISDSMERDHDEKKIAITFDDDVIIGLSQEISYKEAVSMI